LGIQNKICWRVIALENHESFEEKRQELVSVAKTMLAEDVNLILGIRRICALRFAIGDPDNEVFLPIRGIDSETDVFPLGDMRKNCSREYLKRMDNEMQNYLSQAHGDILRACKEIIRAFA
jgi:hypothetical protein